MYYVYSLASFDMWETWYLANVKVTLLHSFVYHHVTSLSKLGQVITLQYLYTGVDIVPRIDAQNYKCVLFEYTYYAKFRPLSSLLIL